LTAGEFVLQKDMTVTLSVRLPAEDKRRLFRVATRRGRSANELVREAIRKECGDPEKGSSPLAAYFGTVDAAPPAPTNAAVRRAMRRRRA
jgi:hypothetical protein